MTGQAAFQAPICMSDAASCDPFASYPDADNKNHLADLGDVSASTQEHEHRTFGAIKSIVSHPKARLSCLQEHNKSGHVQGLAYLQVLLAIAVAVQ